MDAPRIPDAAKLALRQGRKIEAIKLVRQSTGLGLKESKDAVEAALAADPMLRAELQSTVKRGSSRARLWVLGFIALIAIGYFFSHA